MRRATTVCKVSSVLLAAACVLTLRYFHNNKYLVSWQNAIPRLGLKAITQRQAFENSPSSVGNSSGQSLSWWREVVCKQEQNKTHERREILYLKQLLRDVVPEENRNIFLMDTACNPTPKFRVWCSVESWARQNPERQVWFLLTAGRTEGNAELISKLLHQYTNLQLVTADLDDMFRDTPLLAFFNERKWTKSWRVELLANMLRVLALWWWGGVYSDTDIINVRTLTLPDNYVGFESSEHLGNAFLSFKARHPFLHLVMKDMPHHFKPDQWGCIGPKSITRVMERTCRAKMKKRISGEPVICPGSITVYPQNTFYPVHYENFTQYFLPGNGDKFNETFSKAFTLHFWNKMSKKQRVKVNSNSIYEVVAKRFCPTTYRFATAESDFF